MAHGAKTKLHDFFQNLATSSRLLSRYLHTIRTRCIYHDARIWSWVRVRFDNFGRKIELLKHDHQNILEKGCTGGYAPFPGLFPKICSRWCRIRTLTILLAFIDSFFALPHSLDRPDGFGKNPLARAEDNTRFSRCKISITDRINIYSEILLRGRFLERPMIAHFTEEIAKNVASENKRFVGRSSTVE